MILYLARHGNTFESGETVTWVGREQDPALTAAGREQAAALSAALRERSLKPTAVYCAPLKRTREFAQIVSREAGWSGAPLIEDSRLLELDYGSWAGRSDAEIRADGLGEDLDRFTRNGIWPTTSRWVDSQGTVEQEVGAFWHELLKRHGTEERLLVVSSNGRLRFFAARGTRPGGDRLSWSEAKMGTGRISRIDAEGPEGTVRFWNCTPEEFGEREREAESGR